MWYPRTTKRAINWYLKIHTLMRFCFKYFNLFHLSFVQPDDIADRVSPITRA